jgi:hypothetical protein
MTSKRLPACDSDFLVCQRNLWNRAIMIWLSSAAVRQGVALAVSAARLRVQGCIHP